ncbi:hypothetical protein [Clostridium estertheticum]|uniref:hypothetical protein n=1 Tax=Clostridium estertheticum TaxID=238834 RepID=UPI001C7CF0F9|nr:hypothetical protein [Clostridium estertheticum]MBX4271973.1 hypothetical protein [Clostridium estertheticum]WLC80758.1 hypothetical protein KTC98_05600 [Clostridium estertheticum]
MDVRIVNSNFSAVYTIQKEIYRKNIEIKDAFEDKYSVFNAMALPDEVEPMIPRVVMQSNNGHSQITFALNNVNLTTQYSDSFLFDYVKCSEYMEERTDKIFEVLDKIKLDKVLYISLKTRIVLPVSYNPTLYLLEKFNKVKLEGNELTDLQQRFSFNKDNRYFININLGNYSQYDPRIQSNPSDLLLLNFRNSKIIEQGITVDFEMNNRYQYNFIDDISIDDIIKDKQYIYKYTSDFINNNLVDLLEKGVFKI